MTENVEPTPIDSAPFVGTLRFVANYAIKLSKAARRSSLKELEKHAGDFASAHCLTPQEREALFSALFAVVDAISDALESGAKTSAREAKTLEEAARLKKRRRRKAFVTL